MPERETTPELDLKEALARLRTYTPLLAAMTPEERAELFSYDGPEVAGQLGGDDAENDDAR